MVTVHTRQAARNLPTVLKNESFCEVLQIFQKGECQIQQPDESAPFVLSVNLVTSASKPFKTCSLQLPDTMVTFIIDIGAKVSILNNSLLNISPRTPCIRLRELCQHTTVVKSHWREWYIYQSHTSQKPSRTFRSM